MLGYCGASIASHNPRFYLPFKQKQLPPSATSSSVTSPHAPLCHRRSDSYCILPVYADKYILSIDFRQKYLWLEAEGLLRRELGLRNIQQRHCFASTSFEESLGGDWWRNAACRVLLWNTAIDTNFSLISYISHWSNTREVTRSETHGNNARSVTLQLMRAVSNV